MTTATSKLADIATSLRKTIGRLASAGLLAFRLYTAPAPASRPRVPRFGGVYYGKTYTAFLQGAKAEAAKHCGDPLNDPLITMVEIIVKRPKSTDRDYPKGDADNYIKGPLDVLTSAATFWRDDDQIVAGAFVKRFAEPGEDPGVAIHYAPVEV